MKCLNVDTGIRFMRVPTVRKSYGSEGECVALTCDGLNIFTNRSGEPVCCLDNDNDLFVRKSSHYERNLVNQRQPPKQREKNYWWMGYV